MSSTQAAINSTPSGIDWSPSRTHCTLSGTHWSPSRIGCTLSRIDSTANGTHCSLRGTHSTLRGIDWTPHGTHCTWTVIHCFRSAISAPPPGMKCLACRSTRRSQGSYGREPGARAPSAAPRSPTGSLGGVDRGQGRSPLFEPAGGGLMASTGCSWDVAKRRFQQSLAVGYLVVAFSAPHRLQLLAEDPETPMAWSTDKPLGLREGQVRRLKADVQCPTAPTPTCHSSIGNFLSHFDHSELLGCRLCTSCAGVK